MATILVVDDSEHDQRLVAHYLKAVRNYEIQFAANGEEALAIMEAAAPDIVVTDLYMPHMNGLELVAVVRDRYPMVPVVLITSKGNEEIAVQALQRGAASYVPKGLLDRYLVETTSRILSAAHEQRRRAKLLGSMKANASEYSLENNSQLVPSLVGYLLETMAHIGIFDESDRLRVGIALEEALINGIHHGNLEVNSALRDRGDNEYFDLIKQRQQISPFQERRVRVEAKISETDAKFVIADEGPGFDVSALPDPRDPENLERAAGRGVLLMRTFMDVVEFNDRGNQVALFKRNRPGRSNESSSEIFITEREADVFVITVLRNVTSLSDEYLSRELDQVVNQIQDIQSPFVVVDLEQVSRFGSSFLEALRRIWSCIRDWNGEFVLCNVSDVGREILSLSRFDSVWRIGSTRSDTIASIRK